MAGGRDSDPAKARALIDQALAIDPDYIPALVSSFYIDYALMRERKMSPERAQSRYRKTIDRIFELDPNNAMALAAEAFGRWETENNWEQAAEEFGAALAGAPGNIEILRLSAQFARHVGRSDIAVELLEKVAALDPLNTGNLFALPRTYLTADRYEDAVAWFKLHERISGGAIYYYAMALLMLGRQDEVLSVLDAAKEFIDHPHPQMLAMRAMAHHANGNLADRDHFLAEAAAVALDDAPYGPYLLAEAYAFAGDNDAAFEWIEIAFETDRLYGLTGWWFRQILALPVWRSLHADPRWSAAREQVGMSEARMAAIELNLVP
jgi:tetratricopeptide (TPR) repeat protein